MNAPTILECRRVGKSYGGLDALDEVSFAVAEGQIFGVIGPNGAGKTTLFDVISGVSRASRGEVLFQDRDITRMPADAIARLGLQRTFQTPVSFPSMSVRGNIAVGAIFAGRSRIEGGNAALEGHVDEVADLCGLSAVATAPAGPLAILLRKQLMIATALAAKPSLLMLDEPMGGLNNDERERMHALLRRINAAGIGLLIIEHVMGALLRIAEQVLILDHGKTIFQGTPGETLKDPEAVNVYLGADTDHLLPSHEPEAPR
ncbi:MAG: ABC transporter ATP-binding protein [Alphaproteobacteria bacterium]|nr:ABC transporter ATP-binding protein [Alphaproteobacteria bacterium]